MKISAARLGAFEAGLAGDFDGSEFNLARSHGEEAVPVCGHSVALSLRDR